MALDQFLADHPELREAYRLTQRTGDSYYVTRFLRNHPKIAARFRQAQSAAAAPAQTPAPPAPPPEPPATPAASSVPESASAKAAIKATLDAYGLGGLADWAWNQYLNGVPDEQIFLDMRERPEYKQRFPGMAELARRGRAIDEATYIQIERGYKEQMRDAGLPADFYDSPDDFGKLIAGEVSPKEFGERLQMAQQTALASPQGQRMRDELSRLYGIPNAVGAVTAYWIDPDRSASLIKQQFVAAQMAAESAATGFGSLTREQAEKIGGTGVTADQANKAFGELAALSELQTSLIGDSGSQGIDRDALIDATFVGDASAQKRLRREQERRIGQFQGGGGFATSQGGVTGLGSAAT